MIPELFIEYLKQFYSENKQLLETNYPGIKFSRLEQELHLWNLVGQSGDIEGASPKVLEGFFNKLKVGVPLEYISGLAYFYKSYFHVNSSVLIPRSETEILVENAISFLKDKSKKNLARLLKVAEVGVGPGTISLSLLMEPDLHLEIIAGDISNKALEVARKNYFYLAYRFNFFAHKITFIESDRLFAINKLIKTKNDRFDLIVSNPPYIMKTKDRPLVHQGVWQFEPHEALFLEDEIYMDWFKQFFIQINENLAEDGVSWMEGHETHLESLKDLAVSLNFFNRVEIVQDYTNRSRFLKLTK